MVFDRVAEFVALADGGMILDRMVEMLRSWGADFVLVTGLPLPGRPLYPLVLRSTWPDGTNAAQWSAPLLRASLSITRPLRWTHGTEQRVGRRSALLAALGESQTNVIWAFPVHSLLPYQACVFVGGADLDFGINELHANCYVCERIVERLAEIQAFDLRRPGELSTREKRVMELTAEGRTAGDIADILDISQRTVHAHLHNAGEKLAASNKTQTVVEAIRYAQINI